MRRSAAFAVALLLAVPGTARAGEVSIADLVADSAAYDGASIGAITIEGELVGDFQRRGPSVWVQVNGDPYASAPLLADGDLAGGNVGVGARIPRDVFDALDAESPGGYRVRGSIVRLTGEWRHHDEDRGGESYLDVESAQLVEPEMRLSEGVHWWALLVGAGLLVLSGAAIVAARRRRPNLG